MQYNVKKRENKNTYKYNKNDVDLAYTFSKEVYKEFGTFLKAIVLFGSKAKDEKENKESDIDILLVIDDVSIYLTPEIIETYKIILKKIIGKISTRLHITTLRFTSFWDSVRHGDPVTINILRDGIPIIDTGFFEPLQKLLIDGRIKPTLESIWVYFSRAPTSLHGSKWHILQAVVNLYWATIDAAHAALMRLGETPPSPEHVADLLQVRMVNEGLLKKKHVQTMKFFYETYKNIAHRNIKEISGKEYDNYYKMAYEFIDEVKKFLKIQDK
jgi:predicted nucleotidyltransferase/uncharacterized protein (UPF0332 family)